MTGHPQSPRAKQCLQPCLAGPGCPLYSRVSRADPRLLGIREDPRLPSNRVLSSSHSWNSWMDPTSILSNRGGPQPHAPHLRPGHRLAPGHPPLPPLASAPLCGCGPWLLVRGPSAYPALSPPQVSSGMRSPHCVQRTPRMDATKAHGAAWDAFSY